ncbi:hypothetical protein RRU94_15810 [Domibacillus sp. DTU_2020_1001157_1_SI_ALB_TIR_016]|uniref:hypothetical protein n=1 Tax=Domibacillus sp. DTU_2020_1001157_1_SI_ALB_TIR_016 TaxID=3077789 RepID=UPI0028F00E0C|nr:hypothetical protein [Domibacillus sp. DTU_2020_1001157_1_SI_ALB_TIR_016]WNS82208.1 hypothetical protein RRU94_15810 [Domibacillus sp. DTU_2020_1001157_1_SI_ALB_TIR_016]
MKKTRLKHTKESIKKALWDLYQDEYILISFYSGSNFIVRHQCDHEYPTCYDTLIRKRCKCKICSNLQKKTSVQFQQELDELFPGMYRVIGEYQSSRKPLLMEWTVCKHQHSSLPITILKGAKCPQCSNKDKKDTARFIQEVQELEGDGYRVIGEYVNTHIPVMLRHNTCETEFPALRKEFIKGKRCPMCSKKKAKRTRWNTDTFTKKIQQLVGNEYIIQSPYVDSKTHIDFLHVECGRRSPIIPSKFLKGNRCRYCFGSLRIDHEWFLQKVKSLAGNEYHVLSNYQSMHTPVQMKHVVCGHHYTVKPNNFIRMNTRCPECAGNQKKTTEEFKKEVYNLVGEEYKVLGEYLNTDIPIEIKHHPCGRIYPITPANFLRGRRCAQCQGKAAKTTEMFRNEVFDLVGEEYVVLGNYVDADTHIKIQHMACGYPYDVVPYSFLSGARCPACKEFKGQRRIVNHIKTRNFPYEVEFKIPGALRLDVAVFDPKHSGKLLVAFEFQGEQHYKPISYFGGREKFQRQIRSDQKKRKYCMENGIYLIIIPHWNYDQIEKIIDKHL